MTRAVGLELKQWGRETSDRARVDTVEVVDEQSGSKGRGGGRRRAIALELTWWECDTSGQAQTDAVGEGDIPVIHTWGMPYPRYIFLYL